MEGMTVDVFIIKLLVRLLEYKDVITWGERNRLEYFLKENAGVPLTEELLDNMIRELD